MTGVQGDHFTLEVPRSAEHLVTVRIFAASLARRFGFDEDTVADLKLALSEAGTLALSDGEGPVRVGATATAGGVDFHVAVTPAALQGADELGGIDLIRALFADASVSDDRANIVIPVRTS